ncbi:hypothetical protein, partial [Salmonella enterica]|uniref:hypothetical protein n=1 Tax=Salmonella enterica TaxID=28901 RepID=UPI003D2987CD
RSGKSQVGKKISGPHPRPFSKEEEVLIDMTACLNQILPENAYLLYVKRNELPALLSSHLK